MSKLVPRKKILIVTHNQFGYHIDYLKYATYLTKKYDIAFFCWDYNLEKHTVDDVDIVYVPRCGNILYRNYKFIIEIIKVIRRNNFGLIFMNYFNGCSLVRILLLGSKKLFHLDIRTGSVREKKWKRTIENTFIKYETLFFSSKSVISEGLKRSLGLPKNTVIVPLGANLIPVKIKEFSHFNLLYVGTFYNRNIHQTIEGISKFLKKNTRIQVCFNIIGNGDKITESIIKRAIEEYKLEKVVILKGYVTHNKLVSFLQEAHVGISYIPITEYFQYQPATKTYEYLLAGLPVLATKTHENQRIINLSNGVIINDDSDSFAAGLEKLITNYNQFDSRVIQNSAKEFEWHTIVDCMDKKIINKILK